MFKVKINKLDWVESLIDHWHSWYLNLSISVSFVFNIICLNNQDSTVLYFQSIKIQTLYHCSIKRFVLLVFYSSHL